MVLCLKIEGIILAKIKYNLYFQLSLIWSVLIFTLELFG